MNQLKYNLVYKTKTTPFFPICLIGKNYSRNLKELLGVDLILKSPVIVVIYNGITHWFFSKNYSKIGEKALDIFISDSKYLDKIKQKEKLLSKKLFGEIKAPINKLFKGRKLNKRGEAKLERIFQRYSDYGYYVDVIGFLFQLYYVDVFKNKVFSGIKRHSKKDKERIFNLLLSSSKKTNYEKFLFALFNHLNLNKGEENLGNVSNKFYWLIHDYLGDIIDVEYIKKQIKANKKKSLNEFKKELKEVSVRIREIAKAKKQLPKDLVNKVNIIQEMLHLYSERKKAVISRVSIYIRKIIQYRFPKIKISEIHKIYQLRPREVIQLLKGEELVDLEERSKAWVYQIENNQISNSDKKFVNLVIPSTKTRTLKGIVASSGKAKGEANLILNISHIQKFREGNILVAPFTNVNYLLIMKKAKAILTETGGLTSHAAIVSRELRKPCIVGIKDLLSVLKDGDLIEVDANKGLVKIIKR